MKERKTIVQEDYAFAQNLDNNCTICRNRYGNYDNELQLATLLIRYKEYPEERKVLKLLIKQCGRCLEEGKKPGKAIIDTSSCLFRSPPEIPSGKK